MQLVATARNLATVTDPKLGVTWSATAAQGHYAFTTNRARLAWVVRASDGAVKPVDPGSSGSFLMAGVVAVTPSELLTNVAIGTSSVVARFALGTF